MVIKKIISRKFFKSGYEARKELHDGKEYGGDDIEMVSTYNPNGDYIGDKKTANFLCGKRGIAPQKRTSQSNICSIGFSTKDGKWYGWSHRAIYGFKIGSRVKKGDCGYKAKNKKALIEAAKRFFIDGENRNIVVKEMKRGFRLLFETKNIKGEWFKSNIFEEWNFGRGEWTAESWADAKLMAMDFADGVS